MALSPLQTNNRVVEVQADPQPTKTYNLNYTDGEIGTFIDGEQAIRQFVRKVIETARFRFLIYNEQYGSEMYDLIGQDVSSELLNAEIPRIVKDALIYDDRVNDVTNFEIKREGDKLFISFKVDTEEGVIKEEVTV
jgi:phage baseplate assembly protein W